MSLAFTSSDNQFILIVSVSISFVTFVFYRVPRLSEELRVSLPRLLHEQISQHA
jgi:hypothetical protein